MAKKTGKSGSISFISLSSGVHSWSIEWAADTVEVTDFADGANTEKKYAVGLKDWTADIEVFFDTSNDAEPGDTRQLKLDIDGSIDYSGSAILVSVGAVTNVGDAVTQTYHFQGNGTLLYG